MLQLAVLAAAERAINRVLSLDPTALPRLARLSGRVIEIDCTAPAWRLFVLADDEGLRLATDWGLDVSRWTTTGCGGAPALLGDRRVPTRHG